MTLRDVGFYLRGRINSGVSRVVNVRRGRCTKPPPLAEVIRSADSPFACVRLLEGRSNAERERAVAQYLEARGVPFVRHSFRTFEGKGENFSVDVGAGDRLLCLIAHHDAVPGSPGANDNAAAVGILLHLVERLRVNPPRGLRVRFLFTAAEELGYLGARAYVREVPLDGVAGVLSLELCGIGDSPAIWDAAEESPLLIRAGKALEGLGYRRDATYHIVGHIPLFGSDHRAFAAAGIPAYGLSVVPSSESEALRRFVLNPVRSALRNVLNRPPPFDTYHTSRDNAASLNVATLDAIGTALEAIIAEMV